MTRILGLIFLAVFGSSIAAAAQAPTGDQQIMIIIVTAGPANAGTGVAITRLSFPSAEACAAAAKIMQDDIRGGSVTARCLRTR